MRPAGPTLLLPWLVLALVITSIASTAAEPPGSIRFVGKNAIATANGTFHAWKITGSKVDLSNLDTSFVEIEIDIASVDTANKDRDDHLRTSDFFEVEKYPTARARLHSAAATGKDGSGRSTYAVSIDVTIRGITNTVPGTFAVVSDSPLRVAGQLTINRVQWGIGAPEQRFNPMSIGNEIPIEFNATLVE